MTVDSEPVHGWFGSSYANYLVVPRSLMQSMSEEWQQRMIACLDELEGYFSGVPQAEVYEVKAGEDRYLTDLSYSEAKSIGWTINHEDDETTYSSPDGEELSYSYASVCHVILPYPDPVPHYNRGRTRVEPLRTQVSGT